MLLDYLEDLNSKRDYGRLPLITDRVRGRTKALREFIDESRIRLNESMAEIEKVREKEKEKWQRKS